MRKHGVHVRMKNIAGRRRDDRTQIFVNLFVCLCVRGHLSREHPHVSDTTHDDRAEDDVFLGNDLTTPNFLMHSFRAEKVMVLSDHRHGVSLGIISCPSWNLEMFPIILY